MWLGPGRSEKDLDGQAWACYKIGRPDNRGPDGSGRTGQERESDMAQARKAHRKVKRVVAPVIHPSLIQRIIVEASRVETWIAAALLLHDGPKLVYHALTLMGVA